MGESSFDFLVGDSESFGLLLGDLRLRVLAGLLAPS